MPTIDTKPRTAMIPTLGQTVDIAIALFAGFFFGRKIADVSIAGFLAFTIIIFILMFWDLNATTEPNMHIFIAAIVVYALGFVAGSIVRRKRERDRHTPIDKSWPRGG